MTEEGKELFKRLEEMKKEDEKLFEDMRKVLKEQKEKNNKEFKAIKKLL